MQIVRETQTSFKFSLFNQVKTEKKELNFVSIQYPLKKSKDSLRFSLRKTFIYKCLKKNFNS